MRLYEHEAKALLAAAGIPAPRGCFLPPGAAWSDQALPPAPWVVKSQVLAGGRMKAGAIAFAATAGELRPAVDRLQRQPVRGLTPVGVLVETRERVAAEYYCGITYSQAARGPVLAFSCSGGIEVEAGPAATAPLPVSAPLADFHVRDVLLDAGVPAADLAALSRMALALARLFRQHDLLLAEINPLARLADGRFLALDAHAELDEDALYRQQPLLERLGIADPVRPLRAPTTLERAARAVDAADHRGVAGRVVEFDGALGLIIGGGGASLAAFDAVRRHGGQPANYCEIGGNPSVAKVAALTRLLLARPGVAKLAVIMNVVNNTRADLVARGVIKGIVQSGRRPADTLAVFRVPGAGEAESARVLQAWGITPCGREVSIDQAAALAAAGPGGGKGGG